MLNWPLGICTVEHSLHLCWRGPLRGTYIKGNNGNKKAAISRGKTQKEVTASGALREPNTLLQGVGSQVMVVSVWSPWNA